MRCFFCRHGLAHTEQHIQFDPKLCFKDLMLKSLTESDRVLPSRKVADPVATSSPVLPQSEPPTSATSKPSVKPEPEDLKPPSSPSDKQVSYQPPVVILIEIV